MILSESRTADWIRDAAAKNGAADIGLVEKTIRAFSLLEALVNADCPLVFKDPAYFCTSRRALGEGFRLT